MPFAACLSTLRDSSRQGGLDPDLVEHFCALMTEDRPAAHDVEATCALAKSV
jgi:hypothetical protein